MYLDTSPTSSWGGVLIITEPLLPWWKLYSEALGALSPSDGWLRCVRKGGVLPPCQEDHGVYQMERKVNPFTQWQLSIYSGQTHALEVKHPSFRTDALCLQVPVPFPYRFFKTRLQKKYRNRWGWWTVWLLMVFFPEGAANHPDWGGIKGQYHGPNSTKGFLEAKQGRVETHTVESP